MGVKTSTLYSYLSGRRKPDTAMLDKFIRAVNADGPTAERLIAAYHGRTVEQHRAFLACPSAPVTAQVATP